MAYVAIYIVAIDIRQWLTLLSILLGRILWDLHHEFPLQTVHHVDRYADHSAILVNGKQGDKCKNT